MFKPVNSKVNFSSLEENILPFWKEKNVFNKVSIYERVIQVLPYMKVLQL